MKIRTKSVMNTVKKISKIRIIFILVCCVLLVSSIAGAMSSRKENIHIKNIKAEQNKIVEEFKRTEKKTNLRQDDNNKAIVLINTVDNGTENIGAKDIHNIILVVFSKNREKGYINLIALQKEMLIKKDKKGNLKKLKDMFDNKNPEKFYKAIESVTDYKVGAHIIYNNDIIKKMMDYKYLAIWINMQMNIIFQTERE